MLLGNGFTQADTHLADLRVSRQQSEVGIILSILALKHTMLTVNLNSLEETKLFAKVFSATIEPGTVVCLYGPIGSGKTTFVQFVCRELNVSEKVTSPSFVIINEYYSGKYPVYHFDLYRLEKEGMESILPELEEYSSDNKSVTFIEWAEFYRDNLLDEYIQIAFSYNDKITDSRIATVIAQGHNASKLLERLKSNIVNSKL